MSTHRVLYQEGVDVPVTENGQSTQKRIAAYGVAGLRFKTQELKVDQRVKLEDTPITIQDAKGQFLIAADDSAVPITMGSDAQGQSEISFFTQAVGVKWIFQKAGMRFVAGQAVFETEKPGASVSFTSDGVKLDGLRTLTGPAN